MSLTPRSCPCRPSTPMLFSTPQCFGVLVPFSSAFGARRFTATSVPLYTALSTCPRTRKGASEGARERGSERGREEGKEEGGRERGRGKEGGDTTQRTRTRKRRRQQQCRKRRQLRGLCGFRV
eukprot:1250637-Rhodomonas_salina.2